MCYTNPARCIQAVSMAMERVIVELRLARSPAAPAKVDVGAGVPTGAASLPPGKPRALGKKLAGSEGGEPETGSSDLFISLFPPPPPPCLMVGC